MSELKNCPFCGGEAAIEKNHRAFIKGVSTRVAFVYCKKCNARTGRFKLEDYGCTSHSSTAVKNAIAAWNERGLKKLADYEDLDEQGLLIKLPCKLGDIVYDLVFCDDEEYRIFPMKVCSIRPYGSINYQENNVWNVYLEDTYSKSYRSFYDFGKTVFLTREEAEETLKKRLENLK